MSEISTVWLEPTGRNGMKEVDLMVDGVCQLRLNIFTLDDGGIIVDVIDHLEKFDIEKTKALVFKNGERHCVSGGRLVSADFRPSV